MINDIKYFLRPSTYSGKDCYYKEVDLNHGFNLYRWIDNTWMHLTRNTYSMSNMSEYKELTEEEIFLEIL